MLIRLKQFLQSKSALARNAAWMMAGQGFRLAIQALYFVIIARSLGAQNYGAFVGVVGLVGILLPFATMGSGFVLIKNVARDHAQFPRSFGNALSTTTMSAAFSFAFVLGISHLLLPAAMPIRLIMLVAASDLFFTSIATICAQAFLAFERLKWTATITVFQSLLRLIAAAVLVGIKRNPTAVDWGEFYLISTSMVAVAAFILALAKLGAPTFSFEHKVAEIKEGLYFSATQSTETIYNDIDKTMLARFSTLEATGIYGAAYRLIDVSFAPVTSVLAAAFPSFFRIGKEGIPATLRYMRPLMLRAVAYGTLVAIVFLLGAGLVPRVLGSQYRLTAEALRWLAILPLLKAVYRFLADTLTGAGYQALRTGICAGVAVFNVGINMWIIPAYSWRGAAWSSIASDALLLCAFAAMVFVLFRRSQHSASGTRLVDAGAEA